MTALLMSLLLTQPLGELGWYVSGQTADYEVTTLKQGVCGQSFLLRSHDDEAIGPAVVMQSFDASAYRGRRVRFSAVVDARDVKGRASLFLRANDGARVLVLDEMRGRWIRGEHSCERFSVVIDVPQDAALLSTGLALNGAGIVELSDVQFERVEQNVPLTWLLPAGAPTRLGDVEFDEEEVRREGVPVFRRLREGLWNRVGTRELLKVEGETVTSLRSDNVKMTFTKGAWTGTWRVNGKSQAMSVTPSARSLRFSLGEARREVSSLNDSTAACRTFTSTGLSDQLEVCGSLIDPSLRVPLLFAVMLEGFTRRAEARDPASRSFLKQTKAPAAEPSKPRPLGTRPE